LVTADTIAAYSGGADAQVDWLGGSKGVCMSACVYGCMQINILTLLQTMH